jgi:hypothetical protein
MTLGLDRPATAGYHAVGMEELDASGFGGSRRSARAWQVQQGSDVHLFTAELPASKKNFSQGSCAYRFVSASLIASGIFIMLTFTLLFVSGFTAVNGGLLNRQAASSTTASTASTTVPNYFQTSPELYAGEQLVPQRQKLKHWLI